jgi:hypothetical protein
VFNIDLRGTVLLYCDMIVVCKLGLSDLKFHVHLLLTEHFDPRNKMYVMLCYVMLCYVNGAAHSQGLCLLASH